MIRSRRGAIYLIGMHIVPNIVGVIRFSYGFHRTSSARFGLLLDAVLGVESVVNIVSDVMVILLLWRAEKAGEETGKMPRVLGAFVAWNTAAMLLCCGANLIGLRCPPKWYTNQDASSLTLRENLTIVAYWAPLIISAAFVKLYYTSLLYGFYKTYQLTQGRAFDKNAPVNVWAEGRQRGRLWTFTGWLTGDRTPGEKTPAGGIPGGRTPGTRTPGARTPGTRTPGARTPGARTPGARSPGGRTPGSLTSGGPTPGGETLPSVEQATSTGGQTSGSRTPSGLTPGGRTPGGRTPGGRTPGGRTPGGRTATRTLETLTPGERTSRFWSPPLPGYAEASAGTGSTTPASQRPRVRATRQSEGDEGGASATVGSTTTTLSQTKNKRQKRGTATPTVPARLSTAERKPRQSDRAAAEQAAYESNAATSGTSSARAAKRTEGAAGLAADVSTKGSRL
ncbi:mucin-22-like isoform X2 [Dermacentor albipictus]|uniref:mucin-22-like isoform X2 n=1 Tax=Dermacentor albipictus TaxID=60249 RepID=UPI0031FBAA9E